MDTLQINYYESIEDALRMTMHLSQKSYKEVAYFLWPSLTPERAHQRLLEALNPEKNQKLSFDEIIKISLFCNRFDALMYMADACSHVRPLPKKGEDEDREIKEMFQNMQADIKKSLDLFNAMIERKERREQIRESSIHFLNKKIVNCE